MTNRGLKLANGDIINTGSLYEISLKFINDLKEDKLQEFFDYFWGLETDELRDDGTPYTEGGIFSTLSEGEQRLLYDADLEEENYILLQSKINQ